MEEISKHIDAFIRQPSTVYVLRAIDIVLVSYVIYKILSLIRGTRAWRILIGILLFALMLSISSVLRLETLHWLLDKATLLAPVALVILLLPELRQALESFGKLGLWTQKLVAGEASANIEAQTIEEIVAAAAEMSASRIGALIAIEHSAPLSEIAASGVQINARVSAALLGAVFYAGNPLHDGAAVVRGSEIVAAACRLPLSESARLDSALHMRHRAAAGLTEQVDCLVVVVSEERGTISIASEGKVRRLAGPSELRDELKRRLIKRVEDAQDVPKKGIFAKSRQMR